MINHKLNDNFEGHFIYKGTRVTHERLLALLITSWIVILKGTSFLKGYKNNKRLTDSITLSYMTYVLLALNLFIKGTKNLFEATFRFCSNLHILEILHRSLCLRYLTCLKQLNFINHTNIKGSRCLLFKKIRKNKKKKEDLMCIGVQLLDDG
jgi:hypothetical protein